MHISEKCLPGYLAKTTLGLRSLMKLWKSTSWSTGWVRIGDTGDNRRQRVNTSGMIYEHAQYVPVKLPPHHMLSANYLCMPLTFLHLLHATFSKRCDAIFLAVGAGSFVYVHGSWSAWFLRTLVRRPPLVRMGRVPAPGTLTYRFVNATSLPGHDLGPCAIVGPVAGAHALAASAWVRHCGL